jgi:O-succinylhomoserine sulfhydrylase
VLFDKYLARFGIATDYAALADIDDWARRIRPETRMLFVETPSNPLTELADIGALATLARANDCVLVVDNCFCTPALQQPSRSGPTS